MYQLSLSVSAGLLHLQPSHPEGLVSLKGYICFWGWAFTAITLAIALFKQEEDHLADSAAEVEAEKPQVKAGKVQSKSSSGSAADSADAQCLLANGAAAAAAEAGEGDDWSNRWREIRAAYVQLWEVVSGLESLLTFQ
jgi:hypothetical protein